MAETKETKKKENEAAEVKQEAAEAKKAEKKAEEKKEAAKAPLSSTENKRKKKADRREAKAARKAANKVEEKKSRPNNLLLGILIFGVLIGMFAFVGGYNYYQKTESIEKYIEENGGADAYGSMYIDEHSTASLTADGNAMKLDVTVTPHDEEGEVKELKEYYDSEEGQEDIDYIGAYLLTTMKPEVRGLTGTVAISVKMNDEELYSKEMSYREAKKFLKKMEKKAEEEAEEEPEAEEVPEEDAAATEDAAAEDAAAEDAAADGAEAE